MALVYKLPLSIYTLYSLKIQCICIVDKTMRDFPQVLDDIDLGRTKDISSIKHFPKTIFEYRHFPAVRLIEHISIEEVYKLRLN